MYIGICYVIHVWTVSPDSCLQPLPAHLALVIPLLLAISSFCVHTGTIFVYMYTQIHVLV